MGVRRSRCHNHMQGNCFFCQETDTGGFIELHCFGDRLTRVGGDISIKVSGPEGSQIATLGSRTALAMAYAILAQQGRA